jgi:acetone carboxylase gamma subunit
MCSQVKATQGLDIRTEGSSAIFACSACGASLGSAGDNYKHHALCRERPVGDLGPLYGASQQFIDDTFVFREFLCGNCGALLDSELNRTGEVPADEIEVA